MNTVVVVRTLAMHPIITYVLFATALGLALLGIYHCIYQSQLNAGVPMITIGGSVGYVKIGLPATSFMRDVGGWVPGICVFPVVVILVLVRLRSGMTANGVWLFPAVAVAQTILYWLVMIFWDGVVLNGVPAGSFLRALVSTEEVVTSGSTSHMQGLWNPSSRAMLIARITPGAVLAAAAAAAGILVGLGIGRWRFRTGRWEHIEPVSRHPKLK